MGVMVIVTLLNVVGRIGASILAGGWIEEGSRVIVRISVTVAVDVSSEGVDTEGEVVAGAGTVSEIVTGGVSGAGVSGRWTMK